MALTGYAIYAAYAPSPLVVGPRRFNLYSQLPSQRETPTGAQEDAASPSSAPLDPTGKATTQLLVSTLALPPFDLSSLATAPAANNVAKSGVVLGTHDWPGTAWILVVPRSDAGESRSKGEWCLPNVCGPLPVMALPAPEAPSNLVAAALGNGKVRLTWTPPQQVQILEIQLTTTLTA